MALDNQMFCSICLHHFPRAIVRICRAVSTPLLSLSNRLCRIIANASYPEGNWDVLMRNSWYICEEFGQGFSIGKGGGGGSKSGLGMGDSWSGEFLGTLITIISLSNKPTGLSFSEILLDFFHCVRLWLRIQTNLYVWNSTRTFLCLLIPVCISGGDFLQNISTGYIIIMLGVGVVMAWCQVSE